MFLSLCGWGQFGGSHVTANHTRPPVTSSALPSPSISPPPSATSSATPTPAGGEIATEAVCPGQSDIANTVSALACLTQQARTYHQLGPISDQPALLAAAAAKAADMQSCGYGHEACGHPFDYEIHAKGYTGQCYGENIAYGQKSPHDVFVAWMNSPGHRANILNPDYRDLGVAEAAGPNGPLWVMELGGC